MDKDTLLQCVKACAVLVLFNIDLGLGATSGTVNNGNAFEGIDILGSLGRMVDGVAGTCHFTCDNGATPMPKPGHMATSNGCGSYGYELDTSAFPAVRSCCDAHDVCYDTCGNNKKRCDRVFKKCLRKVCHDLQDIGLLDNDQQNACHQGTDILYSGAIALGCSAYLEAQKGACLCRHGNSRGRQKNTRDEF